MASYWKDENGKILIDSAGKFFYSEDCCCDDDLCDCCPSLLNGFILTIAGVSELTCTKCDVNGSYCVLSDIDPCIGADEIVDRYDCGLGDEFLGLQWIITDNFDDTCELFAQFFKEFGGEGVSLSGSIIFDKGDLCNTVGGLIVTGTSAEDGGCVLDGATLTVTDTC